MTDTRELFTFPIVTKDEPLCNDPYYQWMDNHRQKGDGMGDIDSLHAYLESLGFIKGKHIITPDNLTILQYVSETWHRCSPWLREEVEIKDIFDDSQPSFYVQGLPRKGVTQKLKDVIVKSGWIYDVTPNTTYFTVDGNRLFAQYHQILGSRFICKLKGEVK